MMRPRVVLLLVVAAFLLPFALAWWLNFGPWPWRPEAARNRGTLVEPPAVVENPGVRSLVPAVDGEDPGTPVFNGRWSLVFAGNSRCDEACDSALVKMRQSWLALGKDARRVQRWFLATDGKLPAASLLESHPGLAVIAPQPGDSATAQGTLAAALADAAESVAVAPALASGDIIWLLDPGGFVILVYGPATTATDVLRDMQRLLKYSAQDR